MKLIHRLLLATFIITCATVSQALALTVTNESGRAWWCNGAWLSNNEPNNELYNVSVPLTLHTNDGSADWHINGQTAERAGAVWQFSNVAEIDIQPGGKLVLWTQNYSSSVTIG